MKVYTSKWTSSNRLDELHRICQEQMTRQQAGYVSELKPLTPNPRPQTENKLGLYRGLYWGYSILFGDIMVPNIE